MQLNKALVELQVCQGLVPLAAALQVGGLTPLRPQAFNTEEQVFEQRFFVFSPLLAPPYFSYDDYKEATNLAGADLSARDRSHPGY